MWGGDQTELVARRHDVLFHAGSLFVRFPRPLAIYTDGEVILPMAPVLDYDGRTSALALVEGNAVGDTLHLDIRVGGPYGASLNHVRLVRRIMGSDSTSPIPLSGV